MYLFFLRQPGAAPGPSAHKTDALTVMLLAQHINKCILYKIIWRMLKRKQSTSK